jgi:nicotinate dehydrogenase subunit B
MEPGGAPKILGWWMDEAAFEAAVMAQSLGRPVRVQWTREEGIAWDPKAPAAVIALKAGLDAAGNLTA